jgi:hypothetical protein
VSSRHYGDEVDPDVAEISVLEWAESERRMADLRQHNRGLSHFIAPE